MKRSTIAGFLVAVGLLAAEPPTAQAQDSKAERAKKAKKSFDEGMEHYVEEDYSKAIVDFKRAHSLYPSSMLLYNMAMARMRSGQPKQAAETARKALDFDGKRLPEKSRTQAQAVVAGGDIVIRAHEMAGSQRARASAKQQGEGSGGQSQVADPGVDSGGGAMGALGWTGVVTGTIGVAGLGTMPILSSQYQSEVDELERLSTQGSRQQFLDQQQQVESTRQTGQLLTYGAPALTAVGAGLVALDLFVLNKKTKSVSAGIGPGGQIHVGVRW